MGVLSVRNGLFSLSIVGLLAGAVPAHEVKPTKSEKPSKEVVTITIERDSGGEADDKPDTKAPFTGKRPAVDVAVLLDTSNSMDGLIDQARAQIWTIIDQFAAAKREGKTPILRVALFEYGNTKLPATEGYLRQVTPLTDDLDKLSAALFALKTSGGDEYCGQVIDEAIKRLDWSKEPNSYKAIFIAGNEPFSQGPVDYRNVCKRAIENGIVVNTIHCGNRSAGMSGGWAEGASLAEGRYFNIDQDRKVVAIECPQDTILIRLSAELNKTYLWYGKEAKQLEANQAAQDSNAFGISKGIAASRAKVKASSNYSNRGRDLVDSFKADKTVLSKLADEKLPEALRKMTAEQREAHVKTLATKRKDLQAEINKLSAEREAHLAKARQELADKKGDSTLGDAVSQAIRDQLKSAGYEIQP